MDDKDIKRMFGLVTLFGGIAFMLAFLLSGNPGKTETKPTWVNTVESTVNGKIYL